jgi:hypothetical protein
LCGHLIKAAHGVVEQVGARGRFEPPLQELGEVTPRWGAFLLLVLEEPNPGVSFQIARSYPDPFFHHDALPAEVELALVDEGLRIRGSIKLRKLHHVRASTDSVPLKQGTKVRARG